MLCEDTRVTKKLLERYDINTPTISYHQHSNAAKVSSIMELLNEGKDLALVSDAGTPGISDPGGKLIAEVLNPLTSSNSSVNSSPQIIPIPGASAVTCAASISGFPMDKFVFLGFPPQKKKRKKFFEEVVQSKYPVIFYESSHRIVKSLVELKEMSAGLEIVLCRELTKKFETVYRGTIDEVLVRLEGDEIKGEFVVVVGRGLGIRTESI